jgi:hypothetical protein
MSVPSTLKGKQLPGPSRLRHEIHPSSTDDEASEHGDVQVLHSDIVIPETQLELELDDDAAFLERLSASKDKRNDDTSSVSFLTRDKFGNGNRSPSPGPSFTFQRPPPVTASSKSQPNKGSRTATNPHSRSPEGDIGAPSVLGRTVTG